ncbi:MAG TPA: protein-export chaperone SecB [Rhizomicrobium sp.]
MSETGKPNGDSPPAGQPAQAQIQILGQYVKDLSFENPAAPMANTTSRPEIDLGVDLQARPLDKDRFEVELKLRVSAKADGKPLFMLELVYAGLILVQSAPADYLTQILLIDVPHLIFPFARRIVADAIRDGGMPPLMIEPIDFAAIYRAKAAEGQMRTMPVTA